MIDNLGPIITTDSESFHLEPDEAETIANFIRTWQQGDPARRDRWRRMADALHREPEPAADALPPHLHDDAPSQRCDGCGRKTWSSESFNTWCTMLQPGGRRCDGRFRP